MCAVKRIAAEKELQGVHGLLIELFTIDSKFNSAFEVSCDEIASFDNTSQNVFVPVIYR